MEDDSPYCPECTACGHEGCCSPVVCTQRGDCAYGEGYLIDLKYAYQCWKKFQNTVYYELSEEHRAKIDAIADEMLKRWYVKEESKTL